MISRWELIKASRRAVRAAERAYQFSPGSYTFAALEAVIQLYKAITLDARDTSGVMDDAATGGPDQAATRSEMSEGDQLNW